MEIKHIYWFSYYNMSEPSIRYRAKYPLEELKKNKNINFSLITTGYDLNSISRFINVYFSLLFFRKKESIIVFQKIRSNRIYGTALKALLFFRKGNKLYDIDDPDYLAFSADTVNHFIKNCETCSAGSSALQDYARKINPNVLLLTSPVIEHNKIKKQRNSVFTVGWIGYYSAHKNSINQMFFPALLELGFDIKLILLGVKESEKKDVLAIFSGHSNIQIEMPHQKNWSDEQSIYEKIKEFDVGVSPLLDTEVNRAKSAFKLKQYLSCGVPVLASEVGENKRFLQEGVNGYYCNNKEEYKKRLTDIKNLGYPEYQKMSTNARNCLHEFSLSNYCNSILEFYKAKDIKAH